MLELKILSPQEDGFVREIEWNHEEIKAGIAAMMEDYRGLVFTENTIKEAKQDRANLNKLKAAFEDERKRVKKLCMEPYNRFEKQLKEVTVLIDEPAKLIDVQIKEVEQMKREEKRKEVQELFKTIGFQNFVTVEMIWDEKWLNASVPLSKVESQMKDIMYRIGEEVGTINHLQEFSFEALEVYKKTLDLTQAIRKGQELADIQKRKEEARIAREKAEEERKAAELAEQNAEPVETAGAAEATATEDTAPGAPAVNTEEENVMYLDFRVWGTKEQLMALRDYMKENHLKFGKVE